LPCGEKLLRIVGKLLQFIPAYAVKPDRVAAVYGEDITVQPTKMGAGFNSPREIIVLPSLFTLGSLDMGKVFTKLPSIS
jgi:hypothetical protein